MKSNLPIHLPSRSVHKLCIATAMMQPLLAGSLLQPAEFAASNEGVPYSGTGSQFLAQPGFFTATFDPFPASLGTLTAFTVKCDINGQLAGGVASDADSGTAAGSLGGTFQINGTAFNGTGGSNGTGAGPGGALAVDFAIPPFEQTLTAANAGVSYDPTILASVTGQDPVTISYSSVVLVEFANVEELNANVTGSISLKYDYLSTESGEPASITITGFIRESTTGDVTIEWTSGANATYGVDATDNLVDWSVIERVVEGQTGTTQYTESDIPATATRRFYRIRQRP